MQWLVPESEAEYFGESLHSASTQKPSSILIVLVALLCIGLGIYGLKGYLKSRGNK